MSAHPPAHGPAAASPPTQTAARKDEHLRIAGRGDVLHAGGTGAAARVNHRLGAEHLQGAGA